MMHFKLVFLDPLNCFNRYFIKNEFDRNFNFFSPITYNKSNDKRKGGPMTPNNKILRYLKKFGNGMRKFVDWSSQWNHFTRNKKIMTRQRPQQGKYKTNIWKNVIPR